MIADAGRDPATVELGSFLSRPPATVWRFLTDPDLLARWLLRPKGFAASVGTRFTFPLPNPSAGQISCEVLAVRPAEQLTYTWHGRVDENPTHWIVHWILHPEGRGTRFLVTQTGFDITHRRHKMARNAVERSWTRALPRLDQALHHLS